MRFYRALLYLYPSSYRAEYGRELAGVFAARRAGTTGFVGGVATVLLALGDVVPNASAVHWDIFHRDLGYAVRALRRTPGFALTAILVVALGVGANAAAFSVADFVLRRPLPFHRPDQLMWLSQTAPGDAQMELSPPNYRDWKASARSFSGMAATMSYAMNLTGAGEPRRVQITLMTWDLPQLLGVHALAGRTFVAGDTLANKAVLLGYDLWQTQFGSDAGVVGRQVDLDGRPYSVVGIMPRDFHFPTRDAEVWSLLAFGARDANDRTNNLLEVVGRLKDGVTVDQARVELSVIAARLERVYPKENEATGSAIVPMSSDLSPRSRLLLYALCGAAACILLLACANLANLLLVRGVSREREMAVRTALGAGRDRLVRQLVTESVLLIALGTAAGVVVAVETVPALARLVPTSLPIAEQPTLDWRVLAIASLFIALTGTAFGVAPALRGGLEALRDGARSGGRRQRVRSVLVMVEVMASVVLLLSSGLLLRALWRLQAIDPGFRTENVLTLRTALPFTNYVHPEDRDRFYTRVLSGVRALPGVTNAAYVTALPMVMRGGVWPVASHGQAITRTLTNSASLRFATPGYFTTLGIPIRQGRDIAPIDDASRPRVAVVSEAFVKRNWPSEDPIGKHFEIAFHDRTVVGVVGDVRMRGLEQTSEPQVYLPDRQADSAFLMGYIPKDLVIRTTSPAGTLVPEIRRIVRQADRLQPISNIQTLADVVAADTASRAAQLRVLEILAAIALLLATVGIHGLLSFTVSRRSQEIGVRVALGAKPSRILSMFLRDGVLLGLGGLVPGVLIAYAAGRGMQALLVGVSPSDPLTVLASVGLCGAATIVGCLRPALRASRTDPIAALRSE
jgi:putative ABC transport system permease protein